MVKTVSAIIIFSLIMSSVMQAYYEQRKKCLDCVVLFTQELKLFSINVYLIMILVGTPCSSVYAHAGYYHPDYSYSRLDVYGFRTR